MAEPLSCRQCGNRLYPPANAANVRCQHCGAENTLESADPPDQSAPIGSPPSSGVNPDQLKTDDRWAFLHSASPGSTDAKAAESGFSAAAAESETNPFADRSQRQVSSCSSVPYRAQAGDLNPYAPPAAVDLRSPSWESSGEPRRGLPWENEPSANSWWATVKLVWTDPTAAFRQMRITGGYSKATTFGMASVAVTLAFNAVWQFSRQSARVGADSTELFIGNACGVLIGALIVPTLIWHVTAALVHLCLALAGGCSREYETTFRAMAYSTGSTMLIQAIPCVGGVIYLVFGLYVNVMAVKCAHETTGLKAAFAVLTPFFAFLALVIGIVFWVASTDPRLSF